MSRSGCCKNLINSLFMTFFIFIYSWLTVDPFNENVRSLRVNDRSSSSLIRPWMIADVFLRFNFLAYRDLNRLIVVDAAFMNGQRLFPSDLASSGLDDFRTNRSVLKIANRRKTDCKRPDRPIGFSVTSCVICLSTLLYPLGSKK